MIAWGSTMGGVMTDHQVLSGPRVTAIASGKGGVGKSVIAFNVAERLSRHGRVMLIDGDFHTGNLHLLGNVVPEGGWQDICDGRASWEEVVVSMGPNLCLLASVGRPAEQAFPEINRLATFLSRLRQVMAGFDHILVDTASGVLPHTLLLLHAADEAVLVTTPELTSLSDCYALYKVLTTHNRHLNASLLINQVERDEDVVYIHQKFASITEQFLGRRPTRRGYLSRDRALIEAVAHQQSVAQWGPDSIVGAQLARLADGLAGRAADENTTSKTINITALGADIRE